MSKEFESLLVEAFPENTWPTLTRGVREAVKIADSMRRSTPFLTTLVGGNLRGLLRRAAVMWRIQMLCNSGELPFSAEEVANTNGTSHLLSIRSKKVELHIVRTDELGAFPVDAPIRQDKRVTNSGDLFEHGGKIVPLQRVLEAVPQLYGWLSWGATGRGELTHLGLCMPEKEEDAWLAQLSILPQVTGREIVSVKDSAESSAPNPALLLKFREEIARSIERDDDLWPEVANDV